MFRKTSVIVGCCSIFGAAYKIHQKRAESFPNYGFYGLHDKKNTLYINNQLKQGEALEKEGRINDAYFIYKDLVTKYPNSKACQAHFGHCAAQLNNYQYSSSPRPVS
jgi:hypothetical protein